MTALAIVWGIGFILTFHSGFWAVFPGALLVELAVVQVVYARRIAVVRSVATTLKHQFPADRFLVGNARFVGADDRGIGSVPFTTVVIQLGDDTLSLWKPGVGATPFSVIPLMGSVIDVMPGKPPRLGIRSPRMTVTTYLALFGNEGLAFETPEQLAEFARHYGTR